MKKRPLGVTLMALAFMAGGLALLGIQIYYRDSLATTGPTAFVAATVLAAIGLAGGIGMWLNRQWGWWLASFYLTYAIVRYANTIASVPAIAQQFDMSQEQITSTYAKYAGRIVGQSLLPLYLFKGNVLEHFEVATGPRWKKLASLIGAASILLIAMTLLSSVLAP